MEDNLRLKKDSADHPKQQKKAAADEELIKYMSKLPSYLEKGKKSQEKALNVGVLDWCRLEKWHFSQKHVPSKNSRHSMSSNDTNLFSSFSIERSTVKTSRGHSCSPSHERTHRRTLQFHLMSSPKNEIPQGVKSIEERAGASEGNSTPPDHSPFKKHPEIKTIQRKILDSYPKIKTSDKRIGCKGIQVKAATEAGDGEVIHKEIDFVAVNSGVPSLCSLLPIEIERLQIPNQSTGNRESFSLARNSCLPVPRATKVGGISPTCGRFPEVRRSGMVPETSISKDGNIGSDVKSSKLAADKPRSTSPFARLGISVSRIRKTFTSNDGSSVEQPSSSDDILRSGSKASASCQHNSSFDTQSRNSRARSSPLRRLLEPLLKPKTPSFRLSQDPLQRDLTSRERDFKYSDGKQSTFPTTTSQPGMVQLDMTSRRAVDNNHSSPTKLNSPSTFQALLRLAVKNAQPLFTFAVDHESDVLAATVKNLSTSREDDYSCIYTFFAIQELKKKNTRWINQGSKEKNHDYVPHVVAQLRVSGSQFSNLKSQNHLEQSFAKEFILFAVDLQQAEQQAVDPQPNNELAAIVVKVPKVVDHSSVVNTTVILPSGLHSLPFRGGPSSLIQRWRSGGSCDCGGWDLGCELRILANNQNQRHEKSTTSDKFELISQGGEDNQLVFSLAPFKDGIYSVEFSSTISALQAFSLCIAVLDGKSLCEVSKTSNVSPEKTCVETTVAQNVAMQACNGYVSYPPLSPVGRA